MKKSLSGNTWSGSSWDGKSVYTKKTQEDDGSGKLYTITADFRKYPCIEDSIADHSAYLLGAKNGSKLRYDGLKGCKDYKKAVQIIKDGGYATSTTYVSKLCSIIERWNLTQYDKAEAPAAVKWYRVRKSWSDAASLRSNGTASVKAGRMPLPRREPIRYWPTPRSARMPIPVILFLMMPEKSSTQEGRRSRPHSSSAWISVT